MRGLSSISNGHFKCIHFVFLSENFQYSRGIHMSGVNNENNGSFCSSTISGKLNTAPKFVSCEYLDQIYQKAIHHFSCLFLYRVFCLRYLIPCPHFFTMVFFNSCISYLLFAFTLRNDSGRTRILCRHSHFCVRVCVCMYVFKKCKLSSYLWFVFNYLFSKYTCHI